MGEAQSVGRAIEQTVTAFVFKPSVHGALLGVVWHERFGGWLTAGGHVEAGETLGQAVEREVLEEGGWRIRVLPGPAVQLPAGFPHRPVPGPWMIVEMAAAADNHTGVPHIHQDHVFCAAWLEDVAEPETRVRWMSEAEVAETPDLPEDTRLQAKALFGPVSELLTTP